MQLQLQHRSQCAAAVGFNPEESVPVRSYSIEVHTEQKWPTVFLSLCACVLCDPDPPHEVIIAGSRLPGLVRAW